MAAFLLSPSPRLAARDQSERPEQCGVPNRELPTPPAGLGESLGFPYKTSKMAQKTRSHYRFKKKKKKKKQNSLKEAFTAKGQRELTGAPGLPFQVWITLSYLVGFSVCLFWAFVLFSAWPGTHYVDQAAQYRDPPENWN